MDGSVCLRYTIYQSPCESEVSITLLCQPDAQQYESQTVQKAPLNQSNHYEKYRQFPLCKESHYVLPPNQLSKDEWNTKEDTSKSMRNTLYVPKPPLNLKRH